MKISIIVAVADNWVIGKKNALPWYLPADLKHFKNTTMGHAILMEQTTHESIGKALPGRTNIVLSNNSNYRSKGCLVVHSIDEALKVAKEKEKVELFIIGGASIYKQFLPKADRIYMTRIHNDFKGDVYFPKLDFKKWGKIAEEKHEPNERNPYPYDFLVYKRGN